VATPMKSPVIEGLSPVHCIALAMKSTGAIAEAGGAVPVPRRPVYKRRAG
jgi:hypothetical protein